MTKKHQVKDKLVYIFTLKDSIQDAGTVNERIYLTSATGERRRFWAYYKAQSGNEKLKNEANVLEYDVEFILNYNAELTIGMYIEDIISKRIFDIRYINDYEGYKNNDLRILASQIFGVGG